MPRSFRNLASASSAAAYSSSAYYAATTTDSYASVATAYDSSSSADYYSSSSDSSDYYSSSVDYYSSSSVDYYTSSSTSSAYYSSETSSVAYYTTTSSAYGSAVTYGSGSTNWGSSGYNDCVNRESNYDLCGPVFLIPISECVASFGAPPPTWTPPPTATDDSNVHTIIVAPTPGVFRYMPPFVNAKPGEKIRWMWNANNHTVTKSSRLEMCNKTDDAPFASGEQNTGAMFEQVVNDTTPIFFYCGTPTHCQKGMFGTINPGSADGSNATVDSMMGSMVSNSSTLSAMMSYLNNLNGTDAAMSWGGNISMSNFPEWSHSYVMENVLYVILFSNEITDTDYSPPASLVPSSQ